LIILVRIGEANRKASVLENLCRYERVDDTWAKPTIDETCIPDQKIEATRIGNGPV